ncbi:MAG: 30S ribosomal protein S9 [Chlamydiales bacterium]|nr:30S ribosomal protein S9 [Chlamydiia bacterium]MCP5508126.1 30S ribosomal protein S9 [Chlamydiales bacterium]
MEEHIGTGRRKTAVASVRIRAGEGKVTINDRTFEEYFPQEIQRHFIMEPFAKIDGIRSHDIVIRVKGGGPEGQAGAVRLGIARALVKLNEDLRHDFKDEGMLTRDSRKKERKKYGLRGARRSYQFSKR